MDALCKDLGSEVSDAFVALLLRTLSNFPMHTAGRNSLLQLGGLVLDAVQEAIRRKPLAPNVQNTMASFLYNFSIATVERPVAEEGLLRVYLNIVGTVLEQAENADDRNTLIQGAANVLFKYPTLKASAEPLKKWAQKGVSSAASDLAVLLG